MEDTNTMVYDIDKHKYYITEEGFKNRFNLDLRKELGTEVDSGVTEAKVFIEDVTDAVYGWLYDYVRPEMVRLLEYRIGTDFVPRDYGIPYREAIEDALYKQARYMINFDGDYKAIALNDKHLLVSIEVKNVLRSSGMATKSKVFARVPEDEWRVGY